MRLIYLLVFLPIITFLSCNTTGPTAEKTSISLSIEDVSCTEAWVRIKTSNISYPYYGVLKAGSLTKNIKLLSSDTLLYIDSLLPGNNYTFEFLSGIIQNKTSTKTLDTTSHDFTWQSWTFGGGSSSELWDVNVINENDIWAVGQIFIPNTSGGEDMYNAVHWNGITWEPIKMIIKFRGSLICPEINGMTAFSPSDIWMATGDPTNGDGKNWKDYDIRILTGDDSLNTYKVWGFNSNELYFGGMFGCLVYYNGQSWQKLESGTTLRINDIYGAEDKFQNKKSVYCTLFDMIIKIDEKNNISKIDCLPENYAASVWCKNLNRFYTSGPGILEYVNDNLKNITRFNDHIAIVRLRGTDYNNIIGVGALGYIVHFNGLSWQTYHTGNGAFTSVSVKEKIVAAVGWSDDSKALITIGVRN
jgi:hypothetical protein